MKPLTGRHPNGRIVGHGGGFPGLNGNLDIFPERNYTVAVLSNYDRGATPVAMKIRGWIERLNEM